MAKSVADLMTERPRCATPETPLEEVAQIMESEDVGAVPLVSGDRLVGMITDRDIVIRAVAKGKDPQGMPARLAASKEVLSVAPDHGLDVALRLMARNQVRRLPVVDRDQRVIGIVTQADLARELQDATVGEVLEDVSQPRSGPRV